MFGSFSSEVALPEHPTLCFALCQAEFAGGVSLIDDGLSEVFSVHPFSLMPPLLS